MMYSYQNHNVFTSKLTTVLLVVLSFLMVLYVPMATANAQAAFNAQKLATLKDSAVKEIDRRIANLQNRLSKLKVNVNLDNEGLAASIAGASGSAGIEASKGGVNVDLAISPEVKEKAKQMVEKFIAKLNEMKDKVLAATGLSEMENLASMVNGQFLLDQLANVQGAVTKAVESLVGVFDKLTSAANNLTAQVQKMQECVKGVTSGEGSANLNVENGEATLNASAPGCDDVNISSEQVVNAAKAQLDSIKTIMTTLGSMLASSVSMLMSLVTMFSGLVGGLGNLSSLGNIGNLGSLTGILTSFTGLASQLDLAGGMGGNLQGLLGDLSGLTGQFF